MPNQTSSYLATMFSLLLALPHPGNLFSYSLWIKVGSFVKYKCDGLFCWLGSNTEICYRGSVGRPSTMLKMKIPLISETWQKPQKEARETLLQAMIVYFREQKPFTGKSQTWSTKFWTQEHFEPAASYLHTQAMDVIPRASSFPWEGMSRDLWMTWKSFFFFPPILLVPHLLCIWEEATSKGISLVLQIEHSRNVSQCSRQTSHCSITKHGEVGTNTQFWNSSFRCTVYLCGMYHVF